MLSAGPLSTDLRPIVDEVCSLLATWHVRAHAGECTLPSCPVLTALNRLRPYRLDPPAPRLPIPPPRQLYPDALTAVTAAHRVLDTTHTVLLERAALAGAGAPMCLGCVLCRAAASILDLVPTLVCWRCQAPISQGPLCASCALADPTITPVPVRQVQEVRCPGCYLDLGTHPATCPNCGLPLTYGGLGA